MLRQGTGIRGRPDRSFFGAVARVVRIEACRDLVVIRVAVGVAVRLVGSHLAQCRRQRARVTALHVVTARGDGERACRRAGPAVVRLVAEHALRLLVQAPIARHDFFEHLRGRRGGAPEEREQKPTQDRRALTRSFGRNTGSVVTDGQRLRHQSGTRLSLQMYGSVTPASRMTRQPRAKRCSVALCAPSSLP